MKLALIIINYLHYDLTQELLLDLTKQNDTDFGIFIIDNTPISKRLELKGKNIRQVMIENKGYANAVNIGLLHAIQNNYSHFVEINNDVRVEKNFISSWKKAFHCYGDALIGGKIYYEKNYEYHDYYTKEERGRVLWYAGGGFDKTLGSPYHRGVNEVDHLQYISGPTSSITGCMMGFSKKVLDKIGKWREDYFMYFEDSDYCERAKRLGVSIYFESEIVLYHKSGRSTGGSGSSFQEKWQNRNLLLFNWRFGKWRTFLHLSINYCKKLFQ